MPRPRRTEIAELIEASDIEFETDTEPRHEKEKIDYFAKAEALASALKEDSDAYINVSRQRTGGNTPMEFVARYPADKFDFGQLQHDLQSKYGGGDYRIILYINGKVRQNRLLTIAEQVRPMSTQTPTQLGELSQILREVLDRQEKNMAILVENMQRSAAPASSRADMLQEFLMMKQIFAPSGSVNGLNQLTEAMEVMKAMGVKIGGETIEHETSFTDLIEKFSPVITAAMNAPKPAQQRPPIPPQQNQQGNNELNMLIQAGFLQLINAAKKGSDPAIYAEMILDQVPIAIVQSHITNENAFDNLVKMAPNAAAHKEWFLLLGEHVKALIGMPSAVSDLYDDEKDAINDKTDIVE